MTKHTQAISLVEIIFATALLAVVMLGVAATFRTAQASQSAAKEQHAASLAAATQVEDLAAIGRGSGAGYGTLLNRFKDAGNAQRVAYGGFPVHFRVSEMGATTATGTLALQGGSLKPADQAAGLFPPERASATAEEQGWAGYTILETDDPYPGNTSKLKDIWPWRIRLTSVVAWRSAAGGEAKVRYTSVVINPAVTPNPGL